MSAQTKADLEAALQAHTADIIEGTMLSGYIIQAHVVQMTEDDDRYRYIFVTPERQPYHETYGLIMTAQDDFVNREVDDEDD